jgi:uncharacterized membrane protein
MRNVGLGAGLMYLFDPERGSRRRALVRDKAVHAWKVTETAVGKTSRDLQNRARGLAATTKGVMVREDVSDEVLIERVRARLGRVVSHPRAIEVTSDQGRVTLSGPAFAHEVGRVLAAVAMVRGVKGVEDRLEVHESAGDHPALQGSTARPEARFELLQRNWSPAARLLAGTAGGALAAYGMRRRGPLGATLGIVGLGLLARGLTNREMRDLLGVGEAEGVEIQKTIHIDAPVQDVYAFWSFYENFPHFMSHVREVKTIGDGRSHWTVEGPAGVPVPFDVEVTQAIPNELLAWKTLPGAPVDHARIVRFMPEDGGTRADIKMSYNPPAGALGHAVADFLGADPKSRMDDDLARMKTLIETGTPPHDAAQPSPSAVK